MFLQRPFHERWKMLEKEVIEPRNYERHNIYQSRNPYYRYDLEPFRVWEDFVLSLQYMILVPSYFITKLCFSFFLNCLPGEKKGFLAAFYCYQAPKGIYSKAFTWCRWSYFSGDKDGFLNFLHNSSIGDFFVLNTFSICFLILWSYEWSDKYHLHTTPKNPVYIAPLTYHTVKDLSCVRCFL